MLHLAFLTLALAAPITVPVAGVLADGAGNPAEGTGPVTFALEDAGGTTRWTGDVLVAFDRGAFTAALQGGSPALDGALFRDYPDLSLVVTWGGASSAPVALGAAPYAARAQYADVATSVSGVLAPSNLPSTVAYTNASQTFSGTVTATGFAGSGASLTDIPAAAITGRPAALSSYLLNTGGTLTGALAGTTASFSGLVSGGSFSGGAATLTGGLTGTTANFSGAVTGASFAGGGSGLTGVNAASVGGQTLANLDSRYATVAYTNAGATKNLSVNGALSADGGVRVGFGTSCAAADAGTLRWVTDHVEVCNGAGGWIPIASGGNAQGTQSNPGTSCLSIKQALPNATDGLYWVDPDTNGGPVAALQVYCDMTTEGGGWTLVTYGYRATSGGTSVYNLPTANNGTWDPGVRSGSASIDARLLLRNSTEAAISTTSGGSAVTGNIGSYATRHAWVYATPRLSVFDLSDSVTGCQTVTVRNLVSGAQFAANTFSNRPQVSCSGNKAGTANERQFLGFNSGGCYGVCGTDPVTSMGMVVWYGSGFSPSTSGGQGSPERAGSFAFWLR